MKKFFHLLWIIISTIAEIIGFYVIITSLIAVLGGGKLEFNVSGYQKCFGNCPNPATEINKGDK